MSRGSDRRGILKTGDSSDKGKKRISVHFHDERRERRERNLRATLLQRFQHHIKPASQDKEEGETKRLTVGRNQTGRIVLRIKPLKRSSTPMNLAEDGNKEDSQGEDTDDEMVHEDGTDADASANGQQEIARDDEEMDEGNTTDAGDGADDGRDQARNSSVGGQRSTPEGDDEVKPDTSDGDDDDDNGEQGGDKDEKDEDEEEDEKEGEGEEEEEEEEEGEETETDEPPNMDGESSRGRSTTRQNAKPASEAEVNEFLDSIASIQIGSSPRPDAAEEEGVETMHSSRRPASLESYRSDAPSPEARPPPELIRDEKSRSPTPAPSTPPALMPRTIPPETNAAADRPSEPELGLDMGMASLSLARDPKTDEPSEPDLGLDMGMASLSIAPLRPPRSPKRGLLPKVADSQGADATRTATPSIVVTPAPSAETASNSPTNVAAPLACQSPSVFPVGNFSPPSIGHTLPFSAPTPLAAAPVVPAAMPTPSSVVSAPPTTTSTSVPGRELYMIEPSPPLFPDQRPAGSQAVPESSGMNIVNDDEEKWASQDTAMEGVEAWLTVDAWNGPHTRLPTPPIPSIEQPQLQPMQDAQMQVETQISSQPAFATVSQWPTANTQAPTHPFVTPETLVGTITLPQLPPGVFPNSQSTPDDDVCIDTQMDEETPRSRHRPAWVRRRGRAARDACLALAKQPSKKAFRLRAMRRHNRLHYVPVIIPSSVGRSHARNCRIATRLNGPAGQGQQEQLFVRRRCDGHCTTARRLLTQSRREKCSPWHFPAVLDASIDWMYSVDEDVDMGVAPEAPTSIPKSVEAAQPASVSTAKPLNAATSMNNDSSAASAPRETAVTSSNAKKTPDAAPAKPTKSAGHVKPAESAKLAEPAKPAGIPTGTTPPASSPVRSPKAGSGSQRRLNVAPPAVTDTPTQAAKGKGKARETESATVPAVDCKGMDKAQAVEQDPIEALLFGWEDPDENEEQALRAAQQASIGNETVDPLIMMQQAMLLPPHLNDSTMAGPSSLQCMTNSLSYVPSEEEWVEMIKKALETHGQELYPETRGECKQVIEQSAAPEQSEQPFTDDYGAEALEEIIQGLSPEELEKLAEEAAALTHPSQPVILDPNAAAVAAFNVLANPSVTEMTTVQQAGDSVVASAVFDRSGSRPAQACESADATLSSKQQVAEKPEKPEKDAVPKKPAEDTRATAPPPTQAQTSRPSSRAMNTPASGTLAPHHAVPGATTPAPALARLSPRTGTIAKLSVHTPAAKSAHDKDGLEATSSLLSLAPAGITPKTSTTQDVRPAPSTTPVPKSDTGASPIRKPAERPEDRPIKALPFALRPSAPSTIVAPAVRSVPAPGPTSQPAGQPESRPIKALPFALRPPAAPVVAAPVVAAPPAAPAVAVPTVSSVPAPESTRRPTQRSEDRPIPLAVRPPAASTVATPISPAAPAVPAVPVVPVVSPPPSFHQLLAKLPPSSHVASPLAVPVPKYPNDVRGCSKLHLDMQPAYWVSPLPKPVEVPPPPRYVHQVYTYSQFNPDHYAQALAEEAVRRAEAAAALARQAARKAKLGSSREPTPACPSTPVYNPETEDYDTPLMPGFLRDADSHSDSDSYEATDGSSLCGSDGGFEPGFDEHSSYGDARKARSGGWRRMATVAKVAEGAGHLAGSAVKAVCVGARSVAGWWYRSPPAAR